MRVFVENRCRLTAMMFEEHGHTIVSSPSSASLICFTGGCDVNPALYHEKPHRRTQAPNKARDASCVQLWRFARKNNVPVCGICRGAQFISVMLGGKLLQHIPAHWANFHSAIKSDGTPEHFGINSYHHQGVLAHKGISVIHTFKEFGENWNQDTQNWEKAEEHEFVETFTHGKFPIFAAQWHPEYYAYARCRDYFLSEVSKLT